MLNKKTAVSSKSNRPRPQSFKLDFRPQTDKQTEFVRKVKANIINFGTGAPGTGKTFLAIACGLEMLLNGQVSKMIITRPTISSGPEIGFLPGTEEEKMAPFLVPIYEAIYKLLPKSLADDLFAYEKIEIAAISFIRGRNFENCVVIVDEAENLDRKSFYLLLTRVCEGSKMIFVGDSSQIDLKVIQDSGLKDAVQKFCKTQDFSVTQFGIEDCRRSHVVKEVIRAYYPEVGVPELMPIFEPLKENEVIVDPRVPVKVHTNGKAA